jgi:hypothetical protein
MTNGMDVTTIPFRLRGADGEVTVTYGVNEDPLRWGWGVLGLGWFSPDLVRGFPIMQATVEHPAEGYAADMGWIQVVRYEVRDPGEEEQATVFDVPPQLAESDIPYAAFGIRPTFFDAPAMGAKDATWEAHTFLVYTPDAVLSRVIRPICGFAWGYQLHDGVVALGPLSVAVASDWEKDASDLRKRFPAWTIEDEFSGSGDS